MGKQFQVYLLPSDADQLVERLRHELGLTLFASRSSRPEPVEGASSVRIVSGLARVDCLLAPDLLVPIKLDYVEKQRYWSINTLFSEVVEFSGCHFDGKTLKRGRFFYDRGFYSAERWQEKSPDFLAWAEKLFRTTKKSLKRVSTLDAYVGEDAELWRSGGGVFTSFSRK
jgi:hypothetical protein